VTDVTAAGWLSSVRDARANGYSFFDWLGVVDQIGRSDTLRIVLVLRRLTGSDPSCGGGSRGSPPLEWNVLMLATEVPRDQARVDSIGSVYPGAGWHEREAAELFGLEFVGGDRRRLLLDPNFAGTPLRKDEVLAARAAQDWPGVKEPGETDASPSRRRMAPPGVPDPDVWGNRDLALPPATRAEVAASAVGGRVRRPRR
jgi:NADH-quinone oxidoreductase subunit C